MRVAYGDGEIILTFRVVAWQELRLVGHQLLSFIGQQNRTESGEGDRWTGQPDRNGREEAVRRID